MRSEGGAASHARIDERFHTHVDLEWLIEDSSKVKLSAVLVRQFGKGARKLPAPYGEIAQRVKQDYQPSNTRAKGPEYHWTDLRTNAYRSAGFKVEARVRMLTAYFNDDSGRVVVSLPAELQSPLEDSAGISFKFHSKEVTLCALSQPLDARSLGDQLARRFPDFVAMVVRAHPSHIKVLRQHPADAATVRARPNPTGGKGRAGRGRHGDRGRGRGSLVAINEEVRQAAWAEAEQKLAARAASAAQRHAPSAPSAPSAVAAPGNVPPPPSGDFLEAVDLVAALLDSASSSNGGAAPVVPADDEPSGPIEAAVRLTDVVTGDMHVATDRPSRVFLGVEPECVPLIESNGFRARSRKNIAASCTPEDAKAGYLKYHPDDDCAIFEVEMSGLLSEHVKLFTTPQGSTRLSTQHVPARFLRKL